MKSLLLLVCLFAMASALRAEDPVTFKVGAYSFSRPVEWHWIPVTSPMRKAELHAPGTAAGEFADLTFFYFGSGQGGDVEANTQRWLRQFESKPDTEKTASLEESGTKITLVTTEGTFNSGMPGGPTTPMPDQALLGAILENPDGNVFVKMTGPAALVKNLRQKFLDFITAAAKEAKK